MSSPKCQKRCQLVRKKNSLNEFTLVKPRKDKQATTSSVWEEEGVRGGVLSTNVVQLQLENSF